MLFILKNGEKTGPYTIDQVVASIRKGELLMSDYAWQEGMIQWQPIHKMSDLVTAVLPAVPEKPPEQLSNNTPPVVAGLSLNSKTSRPSIINLPEETVSQSSESSAQTAKTILKLKAKFTSMSLRGKLITIYVVSIIVALAFCFIGWLNVGGVFGVVAIIARIVVMLMPERRSPQR